MCKGTAREAGDQTSCFLALQKQWFTQCSIEISTLCLVLCVSSADSYLHLQQSLPSSHAVPCVCLVVCSTKCCCCDSAHLPFYVLAYCIYKAIYGNTH